MDSIFVLDGMTEIKELSIALNQYYSKKLPIKGEDLILNNSIKCESESNFTAFCCDIFGYLLLIGESSGRILTLPYSNIKDSKKKQVFSGHNCPITGLRFTGDNNFVISCSVDGTIIVWTVTTSFSFQDSARISSFNEVLITKTDLQSKNFDQLVANSQLAQQNEAVDYDLKLKEMSNSEKLKALDYNCKLNLGAMRSLLKELTVDNEVKAKEFEIKLKKLISMFENDLSVVKENSEKELIKKYYQFDFLFKTYQELLGCQKNIVNKSLSLVNDATNPDIEDEKDIEVYYSYKLEELSKQHKMELVQLQYEIKLNEEENRQIEIDGDYETESLKRNFERQISFYKKDNEQLQLDNCFMRKKLIHDEEKIQNLNRQREAFSEFLEYKRKKHKELESRIDRLKKHVDVSTKLLVERDEKAFKIKQNNQKLEKMRFINEHQIIEFQNNINPLKASNDDLNGNIEKIEEKCREIMSEISCLKRIKEKYQDNLYLLKSNLIRMKNKYRNVQKLEKRILNAIIDLNELDDESLIKDQLEKICKTMPKLHEEISIDKEALVEIDKQTAYLKNVIKNQKKEIEHFETESKETFLLNIKENLFIGEHFRETQCKRRELEVKFKRLKSKTSLKNVPEFINDLNKIIKIFNLNNIEDTDETNIHILQLKAIEDIIGECKKEAKKLKDILDPHNDPEYKLWMNVIEKFIKLNPETTSQNSNVRQK
jgi:hypothetical protein